MATNLPTRPPPISITRVASSSITQIKLNYRTLQLLRLAPSTGSVTRLTFNVRAIVIPTRSPRGFCHNILISRVVGNGDSNEVYTSVSPGVNKVTLVSEVHTIGGLEVNYSGCSALAVTL